MTIQINFFFSIITLLIFSSCNYFKYYKVNSNQYIVNIENDTSECYINRVKVINPKFYFVLDSAIQYHSEYLKNNKIIYYRPIYFNIIENNNIIKISSGIIYRESIQGSFGGFYYKGYFFCVQNDIQYNGKDIFIKENCEERVVGCNLFDINNYQWFILLKVLKENNGFVINYKTTFSEAIKSINKTP